jgi:quinol monooxygenase YgiN
MSDRSEIRFVFEIEVTDAGRFKAAVAECCEASSTEPGTIIYDWYLDEDAGTARLYEAYASVEDVIAHATGPVFTEIGPRLLTACRFVSGACFGDAGRLAEGPQLLPVQYFGTPIAGLS